MKKSAQVILNEVVSANRSRLAGFTEVAGGKADVVVANPYGITCSGCGFINTDRVTLTTGKPYLSSIGARRLSRHSGRYPHSGERDERHGPADAGSGDPQR